MSYCKYRSSLLLLGCELSLVVLSLVFAAGCARSQYRRAADSESYCLIESRQTDPRWDLPAKFVEPEQHSRMYVGAEQDCGPKPPDDPAAQVYMDHPDCLDNTKYYGKRPTRFHTENPIWVDYLPRDERNRIKLTQPLAIDLALLHSREYQSQFENVYLSALALSGNRFEFDTQWAGGVGALFSASGEDLGNSRNLDVSVTRLGLSRSLPAGGQFATDILNSLVWDFGSNKFQAGTASLVSTFTQPLLRGAFRHVRLERLTQAERDMLYSVRDFARFRRTFYVDTVTSYLNLLTRIQALRNLRANVDVLRQNLEEHEVYVELREVTQFQRDQVFQQYQSGRLSLLSSQQNLTSSLDVFKLQLGLPSWVPLDVDESLLDPFEFVDPEVEQLQQAATNLYQRLLPHIPEKLAPKAELEEIFETYLELRHRVAENLPGLKADLELWQARLASADTERLSVDDRLDYEQQIDLSQRVRAILDELKTGLNGRDPWTTAAEQALADYDAPAIPGAIGEEDLDPRVVAWEAILAAIQKNLRKEVDEVYLAQTQIRLFLIDIDPQEIDELVAISYALENRLDLMNSRATVVDAYRRVEVAADALQSDLSVTGSVSLASDTTHNNAFRFDANNANYTAGVQFDGPLNRLNERNAYRASQIAYQRASRDYMASKDQVANEVRSVLRQLELSRLSFQIARQQLVAATRQVDQAQFDLRLGTATGDSNLTLFLLQALQGLLDAKNNLIANWIEYRVQKMRLFTALEMLYLDEQATWLNEDTGIDELQEFQFVDPEYFPLQAVPASERPGDDSEFALLDNASELSVEPPMPADNEVAQ